MNNSREKFEEALNNCVLETQCMLEYDEFITRDIAHFIWQAATEQSQKEIAELTADYTKALEFGMTRDVKYREFKAQCEALQAREKVLVEALKASDDLLRSLENSGNFYGLAVMENNAQSLANVNNEKKG